jgi:hypothetical protein
MFRKLLSLACIVVLLSAVFVGLFHARSAEAAQSGGGSLSACSYHYGWCGCTVYHPESSHDDVHFYTTWAGQYADDHESGYMGAGNYTWWHFFQSNERGDIFTYYSWSPGAVFLGCSQYS